MKPTSPYFTSLAISLEEHSRAESALLGTVGELAKFIQKQVSPSVRASLAGEITRDWLDAADHVLGYVLSEAKRNSTGDAGLAAVREGLAGNLCLSDEDIEEEVLDFSHQLSERLLARWFSELHDLDMPAKGAALNANMLPGSRSVEDLLDSVDIGSYGVSTSLVTLAVRAYRDSLLARAQANVIAWGDELFLVFDAQSTKLPFRCFASREEASAASRPMQQRRKNGQETAWAQYTVELRYDILKAVRQAVLPPSSQELAGFAALGDAVDALVTDMTEPVAGAPRHHPETALPSAWRLGQDEQLLMHPVVIGIDAVSAALGENVTLAEYKLVIRSEVIRAALFRYAHARRVTPGAAADIFAVNVADGVQCQFIERPRASQDTKWPTTVGQVLYERFESVHGVTPDRTVQMMKDARAGSAYLSYSGR